MLMAMNSTPTYVWQRMPVFVVPDSLARTDVLLSNVALSAFAGVAVAWRHRATCRVCAFCAGGSWHPVTWKITNMSECSLRWHCEYDVDK